MLFIKKNRVVTLMLALLPAVATADVTVTFKGNLTVPDCTINDGNPLMVDFGDVEIQSLESTGVPYHGRNFDVPMSCPFTAGTPGLILTGNAHDAARGMLQTSKYSEGLVIYLYQKDGRTAVPLNVKATDISPSVSCNGSATGNNCTLTLNAALGRIYEMSKLTAGSFSASAGLQVRYE
ncbi:fimbrial protein [Shigella sonnei]